MLKFKYQISFFTVDFFFSPPVDYNTNLSLYYDIYPNYTTLNFEVIAIDNGTVRRGMSAVLSVNVSNTCVMDVEFGPIVYNFVVDDSTGEMVLRIPKYWVYLFGESKMLDILACLVQKILGKQAVSALDIGSRGLWFESRCRRDSFPT